MSDITRKKIAKENDEVLKVQILNELNKTKKQIVQSEDPDTFEKPKDKSFLSDKDRKFDRQSVAEKIDTFKSSSKGGAKSAKGEKDLKLSDLGASPGKNPFEQAAKDYTKKKKGHSENSPNDSRVSSTNDFVEEIPLGDLTYLNTVEYKYYGFYFRIRQKLEQFWGRSIQEKATFLAKNGRRVPASDNLITHLEVTLNHRGKITDVKVKTSSGIKELDDAAIESFNEAGPFPNPPKDLIVNGKVTLEWGFVVRT